MKASEDVEPAPTDYYRSYVQLKGWSGADDGAFDSFFDQLASEVGLKASSAIVEIGFGNGDFLRWARRRGHKPFGYELIPELVETAQASGIDAALIPVTPERHLGKIDVIAAFDVLEHMTLTEIENFFRIGIELLRPGGSFVLRFPNMESPLGSFHQGNDITHITALSAPAIRQVARVFGLSQAKVLPVRTYPRDLVGRIRRWLVYRMQDAIESLVGAAYMGGDRVSLSPSVVVSISKP